MDGSSAHNKKVILTFENPAKRYRPQESAGRFNPIDNELQRNPIGNIQWNQGVPIEDNSREEEERQSNYHQQISLMSNDPRAVGLKLLQKKTGEFGWYNPVTDDLMNTKFEIICKNFEIKKKIFFLMKSSGYSVENYSEIASIFGHQENEAKQREWLDEVRKRHIEDNQKIYLTQVSLFNQIFKIICTMNNFGVVEEAPTSFYERNESTEKGPIVEEAEDDDENENDEEASLKKVDEIFDRAAVENSKNLQLIYDDVMKILKIQYQQYTNEESFFESFIEIHNQNYNAADRFISMFKRIDNIDDKLEQYFADLSFRDNDADEMQSIASSGDFQEGYTERKTKKEGKLLKLPNYLQSRASRIPPPFYLFPQLNQFFKDRPSKTKKIDSASKKEIFDKIKSLPGNSEMMFQGCPYGTNLNDLRGNVVKYFIKFKEMTTEPNGSFGMTRGFRVQFSEPCGTGFKLQTVEFDTQVAAVEFFCDKVNIDFNTCFQGIPSVVFQFNGVQVPWNFNAAEADLNKADVKAKWAKAASLGVFAKFVPYQLYTHRSTSKKSKIDPTAHAEDGSSISKINQSIKDFVTKKNTKQKKRKNQDLPDPTMCITQALQISGSFDTPQPQFIDYLTESGEAYSAETQILNIASENAGYSDEQIGYHGQDLGFPMEFQFPFENQQFSEKFAV
jgi:hypothetical protein